VTNGCSYLQNLEEGKITPAEGSKRNVFYKSLSNTIMI